MPSQFLLDPPSAEDWWPSPSCTLPPTGAFAFTLGWGTQRCRRTCALCAASWSVVALDFRKVQVPWVACEEEEKQHQYRQPCHLHQPGAALVKPCPSEIIVILIVIGKVTFHITRLYLQLESRTVLALMIGGGAFSTAMPMIWKLAPGDQSSSLHWRWIRSRDNLPACKRSLERIHLQSKEEDWSPGANFQIMQPREAAGTVLSHYFSSLSNEKAEQMVQTYRNQASNRTKLTEEARRKCRRVASRIYRDKLRAEAAAGDKRATQLIKRRNAANRERYQKLVAAAARGDEQAMQILEDR
ncbi:hypothetical protein WJX73_004111 [Symbiochloris irregularis]|uniref:Uncharacterized protein n=1 Tax=Symbiochloris irregularis TaxID=706552 RepID=A0AAW1NR24_9CHLO